MFILHIAQIVLLFLSDYNLQDQYNYYLLTVTEVPAKRSQLQMMESVFNFQGSKNHRGSQTLELSMRSALAAKEATVRGMFYIRWELTEYIRTKGLC
jgi:hypothetical protein